MKENMDKDESVAFWFYVFGETYMNIHRSHTVLSLIDPRPNST